MPKDSRMSYRSRDINPQNGKTSVRVKTRKFWIFLCSLLWTARLWERRMETRMIYVTFDFVRCTDRPTYKKTSAEKKYRLCSMYHRKHIRGSYLMSLIAIFRSRFLATNFRLAAFITMNSPFCKPTARNSPSLLKQAERAAPTYNFWHIVCNARTFESEN